MNVNGQLYAPATFPPGKITPWYTLDRGLSGPQSRSGRLHVYVVTFGTSCGQVCVCVCLSDLHKWQCTARYWNMACRPTIPHTTREWIISLWRVVNYILPDYI